MQKMTEPKPVHRPTAITGEDVLLSVHSLKTSFGSGVSSVTAVDGIDLEIKRNETFALIGESGSGKTIAALSVLRLLPPGARIEQGRVLFDRKDLFKIAETDMHSIRGRKIGMIFQDPMTSLNPVMKIGDQIGEAISDPDLSRSERKAAVIELMDRVEIPSSERRYSEFPHQLSGGQRQRVVIAMALANQPDLLIADEPTTALDVTIQAQILELLKKIQSETGMALWLITHDFGVVRELADTVAVMKNGMIVESSDQNRFFNQAQHAYTLKLFAALPKIGNFRNSDRASSGDPLLDIENFKVHYPIRKGLFKRVVDHVKAVDGVSFKLQPGRTLALVGESGCGKTTLGKAILRLVPSSGGRIRFGGEDLAELPAAALRAKRVEMQLVFQDPFSSMNPRLLVGEVIGEGIRSLRPNVSEDQRQREVVDLLEKVGLSGGARLRYPHEFSGGQRQRICIARALAVKPKLIVCDEPTSALDVSVQAQIIDLLKQLQEAENLSYLFISHDLAVVAEMADQVAVMYQGKIVEIGPAKQVLSDPQHEYTRKLLASVPRMD